MTYLLIALGSLAVLILIITIIGLIMGIPTSEIKRNTIAVVVSILVIQLVHIMYDVAAALKKDNIQFYVAIIGGAVTIVIYNAISNWKKRIKE
jgi:ABC-type iron transport system FetAB permease component